MHVLTNDVLLKEKEKRLSTWQADKSLHFFFFFESKVAQGTDFCGKITGGDNIPVTTSLFSQLHYIFY